MTSQQIKAAGRNSKNDGLVKTAALPAVPAAIAIKARPAGLDGFGLVGLTPEFGQAPETGRRASGMNKASERSSSEMPT